MKEVILIWSGKGYFQIILASSLTFLSFLSEIRIGPIRDKLG
jgi:hypothetical protein